MDYGLAKQLPQKGEFKDKAGTLWYLAPEILEGKPYTNNADVWSVGCLYYEMICGKPPFADVSEEKVWQRIQQGSYSLPADILLTELCKEFIRKCLNYNQGDRLTWEEVFEEYYIAQHNFF